MLFFSYQKYFIRDDNKLITRMLTLFGDSHWLSNERLVRVYNPNGLLEPGLSEQQEGPLLILRRLLYSQHTELSPAEASGPLEAQRSIDQLEHFIFSHMNQCRIYAPEFCLEEKIWRRNEIFWQVYGAFKPNAFLTVSNSLEAWRNSPIGTCQDSLFLPWYTTLYLATWQVVKRLL